MIETYNVVFDAEKDLGVYGVSVVESPAMESQFITLNKQQFKLAEVDQKKHILAGVVLIPDKDVYRNQDGREFNIRFSAETIEEVANSFIKNGYQGNSTIEHQDKIEGVSIVQSWVVKDPENDTANAYGLPKEDIKKGSWIALYKCDNKEIYDKALKGEITGFSIDGLFSLEKVNLKQSTMKDELVNLKNDLLSEFKAIFAKETETEKVEVKLGMATLADGETQIEYVGDTMEAGADVFIVNGDDRAPLPVGEYTLEDGATLVISEEGKIGEVKAMEEEEVQEELSAEPTVENIQDDLKQLMKSLTIKYAEETKALVEDLTAKFDAKLSEQNAIIEELKKTPVATPIKSAPVQLSAPKNAKERIYNVMKKNTK
jgi:hypothetical protein